MNKLLLTVFLILVVTFIRYSQTTRVAYIYLDDMTWGMSVNTLLSSHGLLTTLIPLNNVADSNFANYDLIIVDSRTGELSQWGDSSSVAAVSSSSKPILGMGFGGSCLFEQMGLSISWGSGWTDHDTNSTYSANISIYCVDPSMSVFHAPISINIPQDSVLQLYTRSAYIGENEPNLNPGVVKIGREPEDLVHYSIVSEGEHYLWGFTNPPYAMTNTGKALFFNIIALMLNLPTNVKENYSETMLPNKITLFQNYPNPFNPSTTIFYDIASQSHVSLKIFDILGRGTAVLVDEQIPAGHYEVIWDASSFTGGVYICQLQAGSLLETRKLILLK